MADEDYSFVLIQEKTKENNIIANTILVIPAGFFVGVFFGFILWWH